MLGLVNTITAVPRVGVSLLVTAPQRAADLWVQTERVVASSAGLIGRLELLLTRVERDVDEVERLLDRARGPNRLDRLTDRADRVLDQTELLLDRAIGRNRVDVLGDRVEATLDAADALVELAQRIGGHAAAVTGRADDVTAGLGRTNGLAQDQVLAVSTIVDECGALLRSLAPLGAETARSLRPSHLEGVVALLDRLPSIVEGLEPALAAVTAVAPELEEVTDRIEDVGQVVDGLPGAGLLRRRGQASAEGA